MKMTMMAIRLMAPTAAATRNAVRSFVVNAEKIFLKKDMGNIEVCPRSDCVAYRTPPMSCQTARATKMIAAAMVAMKMNFSIPRRVW